MRLKKTLIVCCVTFTAIAVFAQNRPTNSDIENIGSRNINRGTVNFISIEKEVAMGRQLSAQYEGTVTLESDTDVNGYVNRVGQNIVVNSDAKTLPMTFKVVQSSVVDAQAFPGGFIYVNTGTIAALDNEAELAFVLAQLVAHVAARHDTENASKGELVRVAVNPQIALQQQATTSQFQAIVRAQMKEADFLGLQYLYKAGYAPNAAVASLQKLFSSTPLVRERISALQQTIPMMLPARPQDVLNTPEFDRVKAILKK
jgi:beta-barrel assembly-enhancing protease